eukprot:Awhi_evm1s14289
MASSSPISYCCFTTALLILNFLAIFHSNVALGASISSESGEKNILESSTHQRQRRCAWYQVSCEFNKVIVEPTENLVKVVGNALDIGPQTVAAAENNFDCGSTVSTALNQIAEKTDITPSHYCDATILQSLQTAVYAAASEYNGVNSVFQGSECTAAMGTCCAHDLSPPSGSSELLLEICNAFKNSP